MIFLTRFENVGPGWQAIIPSSLLYTKLFYSADQWCLLP